MNKKTYRLLVSGSGRLSGEQVDFVRTLGKKIIEKTNLILLTGGLKHLKDGIPSVDFTVVTSAIEKLKSLGGDPLQRIITVLPHKDIKKLTRFAHGNVVTVRLSNPRSRRYQMVYDSDAVITIEGHNATKEIIDLAWVLEKPILPLPFTGGISEKRWERYRNQTIKLFQLTEEDLSIMESKAIGIDKKAEKCIEIISRRLRPKCFVAMKYSDHLLGNVYESIREVVENKGYIIVRVDQEIFSGSIITAIWDLIHASDLIIADITGYSPNVFYELGISHTLGKKTLISIYNKNGKLPNDIPFDIKVERILSYGTIESLKQQLLDHI